MICKDRFAPGWPGILPRWTSSAKQGVGTALGGGSRVWFTHSHGILNEIYFPSVDCACTRDLGLLVTGANGYFSEEKRDAGTRTEHLDAAAPAFRLVNTCKQGRYRIEKEVIADPARDVVLQRTRFHPLRGSMGEYRLHALLAPHLGNRGWGNTAWLEDGAELPMLFAERDGYGLAFACSAPWARRSVGFVGVSDGWQDLAQNGAMSWEYERAENGNVAMMGEIDLSSTGGSFVLAVGFGRDAATAAELVRASLRQSFDDVLEQYVEAWRRWQLRLAPPRRSDGKASQLFQTSMAVLRTSESKQEAGGIIASLSIPWGFAKGDDDLGGYHLVWPRDLVETAGALLAGGASEDALRVLHYLQETQLADGHWPQNMWLNGAPYWYGIQMDETAFPILLVDLAYRHGALDRAGTVRLWSMIHRAAAYLVSHGPVTQQDRWEEDPGYSPFTLSVEIAALLAAADIADLNSESVVAAYLRETADAWNAEIENWTYVSDSDIARGAGVGGYYVRIAPLDVGEAASPSGGYVPIKNRPPGQSLEEAVHIISPDALALVRFGLRAPDDPRIVNTVKVIDALLRSETPSGPVWHRYNDDGYGEHEDGSPFDGTGVGRAWPLLTGERAHFELAAGRRAEAERLLAALESFANEGGMIPEQVWDAPDIPERELLFGRPSGSAMPLVWAHAEYVKLRRSLVDGQVFDTPPQTVQRYQRDRTGTPFAVWRFSHRRTAMPCGKILRVELLAPANVRWSVDHWGTTGDIMTRESGCGVHVADLPTTHVPPNTTVLFTFFWTGGERWEGVDFGVQVGV